MDPNIPIDEQPVNTDLLRKDNVKNLEVSLTSLIKVLTEGFKCLQHIKDTNLILVIGNTGCGKSTMLSSLLNGPDSLEVAQIEITVNYLDKDKKEQSKKKKQKVIDNKVKDESVFQIGHSMVNSETFLPTFKHDEVNDLLFGDIAGLQDTNGVLIDFINSFMVKKIFQLAKSVRFIFVMTKVQLKNTRGVQVREQIRVLQSMCSNINISNVPNSIQPIVAKCKPGSNEDDNERNLEDIQQIFEDSCQAEVEMMRNQDQQKDDDIKQIQGSESGDSENEGHMQTANKSKQKDYDNLSSFYSKLSQKLIVYDPLNREILDEDDCDIATKRDQLIEEIINMEQLNAKDLCVLMSPERYQELDNLFEQQEKQIKDIIDEYIKESKEQAQNFKKDIRQNEEVIALKQILQFFTTEQLLIDAKERLENYNQMIEDAGEQISKHRFSAAQSNLARYVNDTSAQIYIRKRDKNYVSLIKILITLQDKINEWTQALGGDNGVDVSKQITYAQEEIKKCVKDLYKDLQRFYPFCYELRKQDNKEDYYTNTFLDPYCTNDLILGMVKSNFWKNNKMQVKDKLMFRMNVGTGNNFQYYDALRIYEWPFIKSYTKKKHSSEIQFTLTNNGVRIGKGLKKLVTEYQTVQQGSYQWLVWADDRYNFTDTENTAWILQPLNKLAACDQFQVELKGIGQKKPRLIANRANPRWYSKLIATTIDWHGYEVNEQNLWKIQYFNENNRKSIRKENKIIKKRNNYVQKLANIMEKMCADDTDDVEKMKSLMKTLKLDVKTLEGLSQEEIQTLRKQILFSVMAEEHDDGAKEELQQSIQNIDNLQKQKTIQEQQGEDKGKDSQKGVFKSTFSTLRQDRKDMTTSAQMMKSVPTVKYQLRMRVSHALTKNKTKSSLFNNLQNLKKYDLEGNRVKRKNSKKISQSPGDTIQEVEEEDDQIYNDGSGEIKYTDHAKLQPPLFPEWLKDLNKDVPPLPEGIPVMVPELCPAPPKDYKNKLQQEAAEFFKLTAGLIKAEEVEIFSEDKQDIAAMILNAITQGDPHSTTNNEQTSADDSGSEEQSDDNCFENSD